MAVLQAFVFLAFLSSCFAAKFAIFPMFGRSHLMFVSKLGQELVDRGHEVKIFVGSSLRYGESNPNVRFFKDRQAMATNIPLSSRQLRQMSPRMFLTMLYTCDAMLGDKDVLEEIKDVDVVIGEFIYLCSSLVADKLSCPHVIISAFPLYQPMAYAFGLPLGPSYVPQFSMRLSDEWSFLDRARNVVQWFFGYITYAQDLCPLYGKVKAKHNITPEKSIQETLGRVDMIISQVPFGLEHPRPFYPNTRIVGPFLPSPANPLPDELEQFMQNAGDEGIILVSFGSTLEDLVGLEETLLHMIAETFSKVPQKVIWKLKSVGKSKLSLSDNVKLLPWLPQNDILGHPKTRLFIGHAGINGILESTYHGVPMICAPFFGDQFDNAHMAKSAGFGEPVDLGATSSDELASLIRKILSQPSYRESAARISHSVKLLPRPPVKEAADWVEYTQAQGGLKHFRPRGLDLPFYQLYNLDILLLAVLVLAVILVVAKSLIKAVIRSLSGSGKKEKTH